MPLWKSDSRFKGREIMQTKKESIGYILLGALDSDIPSKLLEDIAKYAVDIVDESERIGNIRTLEFAVQIGEKIGLKEEEMSVHLKAAFIGHLT